MAPFMSVKKLFRKSKLNSSTSYVDIDTWCVLEKPGAHQMEPPSPLISCVNPFPSRFINRTASFPRKVSYFRESRVSPHRDKNKIR